MFEKFIQFSCTANEKFRIYPSSLYFSISISIEWRTTKFSYEILLSDLKNVNILFRFEMPYKVYSIFLLSCPVHGKSITFRQRFSPTAGVFIMYSELCTLYTVQNMLFFAKMSMICCIRTYSLLVLQ